MERIQTARDVDPRGLDGLIAALRRRQRKHGPILREVADGPMVEARIDHSRWIGDCPFCSGAELLDPADPRFYCVSCDMVEVGRRWLPVQFPPDAEAIEGILCQRPHKANRNWRPHETVTDLADENAAHGVM